MGKNQTIFLGATLSMLANLALFFEGTARKIVFIEGTSKNISGWQYVTCFLLPMFIAASLGVLAFSTKIILRGEIPFKEWDCVQARDVVSNENSIFKRFLAKLYLTIDKPILFAGGWICGVIAFCFYLKILAK